jgi:hypothetical protein
MHVLHSRCSTTATNDAQWVFQTSLGCNSPPLLRMTGRYYKMMMRTNSRWVISDLRVDVASLSLSDDGDDDDDVYNAVVSLMPPHPSHTSQSSVELLCEPSRGP